jgi:hypothetical protein
MANLTTARWRKWPLNLGDNLTMPAEEQAFVEVRTGLTKLNLEALDERLRDLPDDGAAAAMSQALEGLVRVGKVPLVVDGVTVATLPELMALACGEASMGLLLDVVGGLRYWNSVSGGRELFSERLSGGRSGTASSRA